MKKTVALLALFLAILTATHVLAAEAESRDLWTELFPQLLDHVGFPVASVLAIVYGITKVVKWAAPKIDQLIEANKKRQEVMAEEYKKTTTLFSSMASDTRTMQATNMETLMAMERTLQEVCKYRCSAVSETPASCTECGAKIRQAIQAHPKNKFKENAQ